jgi:hypothetical protein
MKNLLLTTFLFLQLNNCFAQIELKGNVLGLLFSNPEASIEFSTAKNIAFEPFGGIVYGKTKIGFSTYETNGYTFGVLGKYYFSPIKGFDRLYAGLYARRGEATFKGTIFRTNEVFTNTYEVVGIATGYKWVFPNRCVVDFATGIGKRLSTRFENVGNSNTNLDNLTASDFDFILRLSVGYRFSQDNKEPASEW